MNGYKENFIDSLINQGFDENQALEIWRTYDKQQTEEHNETIADEASNLRF